MTTKTTKPEWIATVSAECAIHGIRETWMAYGATLTEARQKLNGTRALLTEGDHELYSWEPQVGRIFELPPTPADDDLCMACALSIAEGYESPNNDSANDIRFCEKCTAIEDEVIADAMTRDPEHNLFVDDTDKAEADNAAARARAQLEADLRRVNDQLRNHANAMANDMTRLLEDLEVGREVNELGIVQGNGSAIDRLCAQRHTLRQIKRTLEGRN